MIDKLADIVDIGNHEAHEYHLFLFSENRLKFIERIDNGRPVSMSDQHITPDLIRNLSRDATTMHAMLVAVYKRYGATGLYPDWVAQLWLVQTVDIPSFTFPQIPVPTQGV